MKEKTSQWVALFSAAIVLGVSIPAPAQNAAAVEELQTAKAELQAGFDSWESDRLLKARDLFLGFLLRLDKPNPFFYYYAALADYRLASYYLAAKVTADADRFVAEGEDFLKKAMEADPAFGEASSLYGFFLSLEVALHQERGMTLGFKSLSLINAGIDLDPANPRTHLIKGIYLLYLPEAFGGGPDKSLPFLEKALSLFDTVVVDNPLKPSWGKDEALAYIGLSWRNKGDLEKAREFLNKALVVNPKMSFARVLLAEVDKSR